MLRASNGLKYQGEILNNVKDRRGIAIFPDGNRYDGFWKNDMPHGFGRMIYSSSGYIYEGNWNQGQKDGQGAYKHLHGMMYEGNWTMG